MTVAEPDMKHFGDSINDSRNSMINDLCMDFHESIREFCKYEHLFMGIRKSWNSINVICNIHIYK